jgi:hypothetical protein
MSDPVPMVFETGEDLILFPPTEEQIGPRSVAGIHIVKGCTKPVLEIRRSSSTVTYVSRTSGPLSMETMGVDEFGKMAQPVLNYPSGRAAQLYVRFATQLGANNEVLDALGEMVSITQEDRDQALIRLNPKFKGSMKQTQKAIAEEAAKKARYKSTRRVKNTAAQMFRNLIMDGSMTDDEIFAKVQKAFGLDDSKRRYVAQYRSNMRRDGLNPPRSKRTKKGKTK